MSEKMHDQGERLLNLLINKSVSGICISAHDIVQIDDTRKSGRINHTFFESRKEYEQAINYIADKYGIPLERDNEIHRYRYIDPENKMKYILYFALKMPFSNSDDEPFFVIRKMSMTKFKLEMRKQQLLIILHNILA